jgi:hypothetical protein
MYSSKLKKAILKTYYEEVNREREPYDFWRTYVVFYFSTSIHVSNVSPYQNKGTKVEINFDNLFGFFT